MHTVPTQLTNSVYLWPVPILFEMSATAEQSLLRHGAHGEWGLDLQAGREQWLQLVWQVSDTSPLV